ILKSKIQDSKIQLESNSPKLKDSNSKLESKNPNKIQSSKASKDLVNLESQKVVESNLKLDSKTRQKSNKESESKLPKIQRVKNTYDSITIQNSTNSQKSKESSKVKSLIRTIPISIALASALSSNVAAAQWSIAGIYTGRQNVQQDSSGNVTVNGNLDLNDGSVIFQVAENQTAGNFLINSGVLLKSLRTGMSVPDLWKLNAGASAGTIENRGTILINSIPSASRYLNMGNDSTLKSFINSGTMINETGGSSSYYIVAVWSRAVMENFTNTGSIIAKDGAIYLNGGTIQNFNLTGSKSLLKAETANVDVIQLNTNNGSNARIDNFEVSNGATIEGNISLRNASSITNGITIINSGSLQGHISLTGNARIQGGIVLDNASTITGNISLTNSNNNNTMSIDNISLTNSTIGGTISLSETASDYNKSTNTLTSLTLSDSHLGGISLTGNSLITNGIMANSSTIDNITLAGNSNSGAKPTIVNGVSLDNSEVTGDISLDNSSVIMGGFTLGNNSTIANLNILKRG
ncbi:hypothetical protein, partial [Helicobacter pullorum]|uniref:hypothetical protein n=1 Tax=Helicobacter pullorum TaxID=35818 RepID=UPI000197A4E8